MSDLAITIQPHGFDLSIENRDLALSEGLENAIFISLFSDARARDDDKLPSNENDKRGWWGDAFESNISGAQRPIGSRLWLLSRAKLTSGVLTRAEEYCQEALIWLVQDGIAKSVKSDATRIDNFTMALVIEITKPDGQIFKFEKLWNSIDAGAINGVGT